MSGITINVTRIVGAIWVNKRTSSSVRATVHSFLDLAEAIGQICGGFTLVVIAGAAGMVMTLLTAAVLMAFTGTMVALARDRASPGAAMSWRADEETWPFD